MRKINVNEAIGKSRFNKFFLSVFLLGLLAVVFDGYDMAVYGVTLTPMMASLGLNATHTGMLASAATFGMIVGSVASGILADKFGRKKILILGICLYSVFTGLCGFIDNVQIFAVFRFIAGFGLAGVIPLVTALLSEYSPRANRNFLVTFSTLGNGIGQTLCVLIGLLLLRKTEWSTMYLFAFIPLLLALLMYLFYPESMIFHLKRGNKEKIADILSKANPQYTSSTEDEYEINAVNATKSSLVSLFKNGLARNTILITILFICNFYIAFAISTWMPKLMSMMDYSFSGLVFTFVYFCGGLLSAPVAGIIADKVGLKKVMTIVYIVSTICILVSTIKMNQNLFVVLLFIMGAFLNLPTLLTFSFAAQNFPLSIRGTALGLSAGVGRIGSVVSPIIIGALITIGTPVNITFATIAIPAFIGAVCILLIKKDVTIHAASIKSIRNN